MAVVRWMKRSSERCDDGFMMTAKDDVVVELEDESVYKGGFQVVQVGMKLVALTAPVSYKDTSKEGRS
jgi:hypothetical protein